MTGLTVGQGCGDLVVSDGSITIGNASEQTVEHVLVSMRGELKEHPLLGGEIRKMMHGCGQRLWCARARDMCRAAGVNINRVYVREDRTIVVE